MHVRLYLKSAASFDQLVGCIWQELMVQEATCAFWGMFPCPPGLACLGVIQQ